MDTSLSAPVKSLTIKANHSIRPLFPKETEFLFEPRFHFGGPSSLKLNDLVLWKHPNQESLDIRAIRQYLVETRMLSQGLCLLELELMKAIGIKRYNEIFGSGCLIAPRSTIRLYSGKLAAPTLTPRSGVLAVEWRLLDQKLDTNDIVPYLPG